MAKFSSHPPEVNYMNLVMEIQRNVKTLTKIKIYTKLKLIFSNCDVRPIIFHHILGKCPFSSSKSAVFSKKLGEICEKVVIVPLGTMSIVTLGYHPRRVLQGYVPDFWYPAFP